MEIIITLIIWAFFGWLGYTMAQTRKRNEVLWAFLGVIFGIFAIVVLALIGEAKEAN